MPAAKELTPRQRTVLQWVIDGCPTNPEVPSTYKTTARTLEGHELVKVKGHGKTWQATVTERGKRVLAGKEPLRKPKRKRGAAPETVVASPIYAPPEPPHASEVALDARVTDLLEDLVASRRGWVVRRVENRDVARTNWDPVDRWVKGLGKALVPDGKEFMLDWSSDSWHFDSPVTVTAALLDTDEWLSPDPGPVLRGEVEVRKFHPAINRLLRTSKWYSAETKQRAKLLLHVVVTEAQARGWSVTAHDTEDYKGKKVLEKVTLDTDHRSYEVWASERENNVERPPTKKEVKAYEDSLRWSYNKGKEMPKYYVKEGTGLVSLTFGFTRRNDTPAKPTRLNSVLGDFFADVHRREQWYAVVEERDRLEAERRQRRLDKATELARVHHREGERHKVLLRRVEAWKERREIEEYLDALEGVPEAEEWLNWCRERLTKTSALGETDLPMAVPFDEHENRGLIAAFEQRLPEDESQW